VHDPVGGLSHTRCAALAARECQRRRLGRPTARVARAALADQPSPVGDGIPRPRRIGSGPVFGVRRGGFMRRPRTAACKSFAGPDDDGLPLPNGYATVTSSKVGSKTVALP
jgi:hypothetical protein